MNIQHIVESIDSLAPLSDAIIKIQELDINKLISLIESDAILSLNILKMANSPTYGFSSRIASVGQAVTLFGIMQIYGFIMKYVVAENIKAKTEVFGFSNERFNDICNIQSALLLQWYSKIDRETAKFLAPLALIMESGKLVIANEVSMTSYEKEFEEGFRKSKNTGNYEKVLIGKTSYELSSMVFKHWHMEPMYIQILEDLSSGSAKSETVAKCINILNVVVTAVNLKSILSKESVLGACKLVQNMGLDPEEFADIALKVKRAYILELKVRQEES